MAVTLPVLGDRAGAMVGGDRLPGARVWLPVLLGIPGAARQRREHEAHGVPRVGSGVAVTSFGKSIQSPAQSDSPIPRVPPGHPGPCGPGALFRGSHHPTRL